MASPASLGQTLNEAVTDTFFNERSAVKLSFANSGSVVNEDAGLRSTIATAQSLSLSSLIVPNTIPQFIPGTTTPTTNYGKTFDVRAVTALGSLSIAGQQDFYAFNATAGQLFNIEVMSQALTPGGSFRYSDRIDSILTIYDGAGNIIPYYNGTAQNDDEFETTDSVLMDLTMPSTGTFYARVNAFSNTDTGNYELFLYSFAANAVVSAPEPGTVGLVIVGLLPLVTVLTRRRKNA